MEIKDQLIHFLSELPISWNSRKRYVSIGNLIPEEQAKINWEGSANTVFGELIDLLASDGQEALLVFLDKLANADENWIGLDHKQQLITLRADIKSLDSAQWLREFGRYEVKKEKRLVGLESLPKVPVWEGRNQLIEDLKAKLMQSTNPPKVLALIGQGGIGKTSLAVKLIEAIGVNLKPPRKTEDFPYDGAIYLKVQEGTSFDDIAAFLLKALSIETANTLQKAAEKIQKIIEGLTRAKYLLVLDNLEDILQPANQSEENENCVHPRYAISADVGSLLNAFVYDTHCSQIIITSREVPADLADPHCEGTEIDSELVWLETLSGVAADDGIKILQKRNLQDCEEDLYWVAERVEGNVFLLTQLALLAKGKPGYLRKHPEKVTNKAAPILIDQLGRQSKAARDLLKRMCVLRMSIDIKYLTFLHLYSGQDERFNRAIGLQDICTEPSEKVPWAVDALRESVDFTKKEITRTEVIIQQLFACSLIQSHYQKDEGEDFYKLDNVLRDFLREEYEDELPKLWEIAYEVYRTGENIPSVQEAQYLAFELGKYTESFQLLRWILDPQLTSWGYWQLLREKYEQIIPYLNDGELSGALLRLSVIYRDNIGQWDKAKKLLHHALYVAKTQNDKFYIGGALGELGNIESNLGNWKRAKRLYTKTLQIYEELYDKIHDAYDIAAAWAALAQIESFLGNWDTAEGLYKKALQFFGNIGSYLSDCNMIPTYVSWGNIKQLQGKWDEAEQLYQNSFNLSEKVDSISGLANAYALLGNIDYSRGNWDKGEQLYQQALELWKKCDSSSMPIIEGLAVIEQFRGNWEKSEQYSRQLLKFNTELGNRQGIVECLNSLANLQIEQSNWEEAKQLYQNSLELAKKLGYYSAIAYSKYGLGKVELGEENLDEAEPLLTESLTMAEERQMAPLIAETRYNLAKLWRKRDNLELAQEHYDTAHQIFQQLGATKDLEKIEQEWNN